MPSVSNNGTITPRSAASATRNQAKHPHDVQGIKRFKHQPDSHNAAPHTRHLPQAKKAPITMLYPGKSNSIRGAPLPNKPAKLPSREIKPEFETFSPFDVRFPQFTSSSSLKKQLSNKLSPSSRSNSRSVSRSASKTRSISANKSQHSKANNHSHHSRQQKLMPTDKHAKKGNVKPAHNRHAIRKNWNPRSLSMASVKMINGSLRQRNRMMKEHRYHIPHFMNEKNWRLAGYQTYNPFETMYGVACGLISGNRLQQMQVASQHKNRVKAHRKPHHQAGVAHHPGHHQPKNPATQHHQALTQKQNVIQSFYNHHPFVGHAQTVSQNNVMSSAPPLASAFPRMSPMNFTSGHQPNSFYMVPNQATTPAQPIAMNGFDSLPGSMLAFAPSFSRLQPTSSFSMNAPSLVPNGNTSNSSNAVINGQSQASPQNRMSGFAW